MSDTSNQDVNTGDNTPSEIEVQARRLGWVPQDEFRGAPEKWKPAEEFVSFGLESLPVLRENNRRMQEKLGALEELVREGQTSMKALVEFQQNSIEAARRAERAAVRRELAEARREGDADRETELEERLDELRAPPPLATPPAPAPAPAIPQAQKDWQDANPWFGVDQEKSALVVGIGNKLRAADPSLQGKALFDAIDRRLGELFPTAPRTRTPDRVEGGTRSAGGGATGTGAARSYESLPAAARAACDELESTLVGKGRAFATQADWRKHYVANYSE